jgi:hypothetical protein
MPSVSHLARVRSAFTCVKALHMCECLRQFHTLVNRSQHVTLHWLNCHERVLLDDGENTFGLFVIDSQGRARLAVSAECYSRTISTHAVLKLALKRCAEPAHTCGNTLRRHRTKLQYMACSMQESFVASLIVKGCRRQADLAELPALAPNVQAGRGCNQRLTKWLYGRCQAVVLLST